MSVTASLDDYAHSPKRAQHAVAEATGCPSPALELEQAPSLLNSLRRASLALMRIGLSAGLAENRHFVDVGVQACKTFDPPDRPRHLGPVWRRHNRRSASLTTEIGQSGRPLTPHFEEATIHDDDDDDDEDDDDDDDEDDDEDDDDDDEWGPPEFDPSLESPGQTGYSGLRTTQPELVPTTRHGNQCSPVSSYMDAMSSQASGSTASLSPGLDSPNHGEERGFYEASCLSEPVSRQCTRNVDLGKTSPCSEKLRQPKMRPHDNRFRLTRRHRHETHLLLPNNASCGEAESIVHDWSVEQNRAMKPMAKQLGRTGDSGKSGNSAC
ncbi:unnamed protein product [Protopolystoma xenopodis]|uniref:Uncharacterized protein n=1 Tax=Protopolystoma xenopodis TaxID=117903 RepID=A0A3S5AEW7_9PLAT|nr:unnamed protein product [Protopolystoma xenopodis]